MLQKYDDESLVLIDGFNLLSRCYFATAYGKTEDKISRTAEGIYNNALRVKVQKLLNLMKAFRATHFAVVWDVKRNETKRKEIYDDYKGTRGELPLPLIQQYQTATEIFQLTGIPQMTVEGYEADDVIGALSKRWSEEKNKPCIIYSNDRDLFQLLDENVSQVIAKKKQGDILYTVDHFREEFQIEPFQWIDVKALLGDKSDNIPGVPGVGEKAALPLIQDYHSINNLYDGLDELDQKFKRYKNKLAEGKEFAYLSKKLVEIERDIQEVNELDFKQISLALNRQVFIKEMDRLEITIKVG
ncbi:5'-3' exonuclease [Pseudalkalibacillus caeni]|uniref:5'-3' exonuclease n=1 Tax=Exobacillus caeni TaxID=2574798 RepID=A0A5R9F1P6_9BACL|nr:5'-3' exonuclease H3TH domain-containing protein [Pseudalkalibacillus caeni]TLS37497.1 flap endonuclease [Pseudalkalibacillus caeni]